MPQIYIDANIISNCLLSQINEYTSIDIEVLLVIHYIDFPNSTIAPDWYNGRKRIHELSIYKSNFSSIQSNAFNSEPFESVQSLDFSHNTDFRIEDDTFWGLKKLTFLRFLATNVAGITNHFFIYSRRILQTFVLHAASDETRLRDLFGSFILSNLKYATVTYGNRSTTRILGPNDLSGLVVIQTLFLSKCGFISIEPKTFDLVGMTVAILDLSENKLKSLRTNLFATFLDSFSPIIKGLYFYTNPLECGCDFDELRTLIICNTLRVSERAGFLRMHSCKETNGAMNSSSNCPFLQVVHGTTLYLNGINENSLRMYSFPKVILRVSNGVLIVSTKVTGKMRLWMVNHQNDQKLELRETSKCPSIKWVRQYVGCVLLPGENKTFPLDENIHQGIPTTFCVILSMSNKHAWPLHCQTIRLDGHEIGSLLVSMITVMVCACIGGFSVGAILYYFWKAWKSWKEWKAWRKTEEEVQSIEENGYEDS